MLRLVSSTYSQPVSVATYTFETPNQAGASDAAQESFTVIPDFLFASCGPGIVSGTVTLGPRAQDAAECASPGYDIARPRFREAYQPLIDHLQPAAITAGSPGFAIQVFGAGFVPGTMVRVFDREGIPLAARSEELPAGGRVSRLLSEWFPELAGRRILSGYILLNTSTPVSAFGVFGTRNNTALAAVPSQIR